jgi:hypothetical protein
LFVGSNERAIYFMARNYLKLLRNKERWCAENGYTVKYVDTLKDYAGMNFYAAEKFGFPFPYSPTTILISQYLPIKDKFETLNHEIDEIQHMSKGMCYWKSHVKALRVEDYVS